jgi:iron complex outermembrane receptor protein
VDANDPKRIHINQYGVYTQIAKTISRIRLTGSIRYDKMDNFKGHFTPRFSAVYAVSENSNFRASFQTGFRLPDTQAQYIYFYNPSGILLGGNPSAASRYNIYGANGAYTLDSYNSFLSTGGKLNSDGTTTGGDASKLQHANLSYVKPEQLISYEVGYKGVIAGKLLIDVNYYYSYYNNFLGEQYVVSSTPTLHQGNTIGAGTTWYPYVNSPYKLTSQGVGVGLTYNLPRSFALTGNYNFATFSGTSTNDFQAGFNTPKNKYNIGLGNRRLTKSLGFSVNFRYQDSFMWQSSYGVWQVPSYGVVDAQITYRTPLKTTVKIGGTNIGGHDYRTNFGAPFIGQTYFVSLTFDELLK